MNQKVSTGLGTAILMVMAFTAGYLVWVIESRSQEDPIALVTYNDQEVRKNITNKGIDSTKIQFNDCGKIDSYSNELWYGDVMSRLGEFKQSERGILDVCQSLDKSLVIILTNGGSTDGLIPYCEAGSLFKYSVANKILSQATFDDRGRGCVAWPSEFGQRSGNMILLQGFGGDAGCGSTMYYEYDFMSDAVILKKECSKCEGEETEVCKDNFLKM